MSLNKLTSGGRKRGRGYWTPKRIARVLKYYAANTRSKTLAHYRISGSQLHEWKTPNSNAAGFGLSQAYKEGDTIAFDPGRYNKEVHVMARQLRKEVTKCLQAGYELNDLLIYAHMLTKEILK